MFSWCFWLDRFRSPQRRRGTGESVALDNLLHTSRRHTQTSFTERSFYAAEGGGGSRHAAVSHHRHCSVTYSPAFFGGRTARSGGRQTATNILRSPSLSCLSQAETTCRLKTTETSPAVFEQVSARSTVSQASELVRIKGRCAEEGQQPSRAAIAGGQRRLGGYAGIIGGNSSLKELSKSKLRGRQWGQTERVYNSARIKGLDRRISSVL